MIDKTVKYEDYDGEPQVETLWFHLTKQDILDNLDLKEQFEALQAIFTSEKRSLSLLEVKQILELVKRIVNLSYGERSEDRKRFRKGSKHPEVWDAFYESAVYDEFLSGLFAPDPSKAFEFLLAVMPKGLMAEAEAEVAQKNPEMYKDYQTARGELNKKRAAVVAPVEFEVTHQTEPFGDTFAEPVLTKKPAEMSREELEAALNKIKNS